MGTPSSSSMLLKVGLQTSTSLQMTYCSFAIGYIQKSRMQAYLIVLCFPNITFFTNWRFAATLRWVSLSAPFFQELVHTSCLYVAFWSFLQYFNFFIIIIFGYGDLWSVIFDITIVIVFEGHKPHPYKMANLIHECCVCTSPFSETKNHILIFKIGPINNPTRDSKCSREKSHISL